MSSLATNPNRNNMSAMLYLRALTSAESLGEGACTPMPSNELGPEDALECLSKRLKWIGADLHLDNLRCKGDFYIFELVNHHRQSVFQVTVCRSTGQFSWLAR